MSSIQEKDIGHNATATPTSKDSELGSSEMLSADALQLATLGHHEELGKLRDNSYEKKKLLLTICSRT